MKPYYKHNGIETIDVIKTIFDYFGDDINSLEAACIFNIVKYLMRYKYKKTPAQDLEKIKVYVDWLMDENRKEQAWV